MMWFEPWSKLSKWNITHILLSWFSYLIKQLQDIYIAFSYCKGHFNSLQVYFPFSSSISFPLISCNGSIIQTKAFKVFSGFVLLTKVLSREKESFTWKEKICLCQCKKNLATIFKFCYFIAIITRLPNFELCGWLEYFKNKYLFYFNIDLKPHLIQ